MAEQSLIPSKALAQRVAAGDLQEDAGQYTTACQLDQLRAVIIDQQSHGWLRNFIRRTEPMTGLYIYGGVGRGKTMLMDMFFASLPHGNGVPIGWRLHFHDFMVLAQDLIHAAREAGTANPIAQAAKQLAGRGQVLCFDEMEVRDIADAMILARLFTAIFDEGVTLVATSNRHADDLYKDGLHRDRFLPFIALLKQRCELVEIAEGPDRRGSVLADMQAWYAPDDSHAAVALEQAFDALRGASEATPSTLRVAGRDVVIECSAGDVALVTFAELCEAPLAARDYLAVAGKYAGIVMRGVPSFGDQNEASARRFMWLVDALYDRSRFLIASAATDIDALYEGHHFAFEFSRTMSRLSEMTCRGKLFQTDI